MKEETAKRRKTERSFSRLSSARLKQSENGRDGKREGRGQKSGGRGERGGRWQLRRFESLQFPVCTSPLSLMANHTL